MISNWIPTLSETDKPIYLRIARAIESDVCDGTLQPGAILPTHRDLADRLGVAIGTVTKAYQEAEKRGLIYGQGRSGTFVRDTSQAGSTISRMVGSHSCDDLLIYTLPYGAQIPDFSKILKKLWSKPKKNPHKYWPPESNQPQHFKTGASWIARVGLEVSPEEIVVTPGNHHGILVTLASETKSGDVVAAESHTYLGLPDIAKFLGLKLIGLNTDSEGIIPEDFEAACRKHRIKALHCTPSVQNPTNASMPETRAREIVSIAEKYGVILLEDDVVRPVMTDPPPLIKSLAPDNCHLIASPSKVLCPGLRIGYIVPPTSSRQRLLDSLRATMAFPGGLPSEVLGQMLSDGTADNTLIQAKREGIIRQRIAGEYLPSKLVQTNAASPYVWLELPEHWTAHAFAAEASRRGILVLTADVFAVDPERAARAVRLVIGRAHNHAVFKDTVQTLADLLNSHSHSSNITKAAHGISGQDGQTIT
jgi:DNA-binding transcriptional MocR family regulator